MRLTSTAEKKVILSSFLEILVSVEPTVPLPPDCIRRGGNVGTSADTNLEDLSPIQQSWKKQLNNL